MEAAEYIRGSTFIWEQIAEQLADQTTDDRPVEVEIHRKTVNAERCEGLADRVGAFLRSLDEVLGDLNGGSTQMHEVVLDGASFRIQLAVKDSLLSVYPDGLREPPLQKEAGRLHSLVSGCSDVVAPIVERHDF
jgi:hypothetical protein